MKKDVIEIAFLGDISLNNGYADLKLNPFNEVTELYKNSDYAVGNLEALLKGDEGLNLEKTPYLFAEKNAYQWLPKLNLNLVSTAHNHVYDNFDSGYTNSIRFLNKHKIDYLGSGFNTEATAPFFVNIKGKKIAFLNYCHSNTNFKKPKATSIHLNVYDSNIIIDEIEKTKEQADIIILLLHWGGKSDYGSFPKMDQVKDAKRFIDNGADAIIGHHAHCIQPVEYYNGKPIAYCLGNFCFDDIDCEGKISHLRNSGKNGIIVQLFIGDKTIKIKWKGVKNKHLNILPAWSIKLKVYLINLVFKFYKRSTLIRKLHEKYMKKLEPLLFYIETTKYNVVAFVFHRIYIKAKRKLIN